jgi:nucleoside-diphosphate-sugar epimerase
MRALARSPEAAAVVSERGADPVAGDLMDVALLTEAIQGCTAVLHAAARHREGGSLADHRRDNVGGTDNVLAAAQAAGVDRFVLVGAAMCLLGGAVIEHADETWPLNEPTYSSYARTKTIADRAVLAANREGFTTSVLRPGWVWGSGDPQITSVVAAGRKGQLRLIDGGGHPIVTSHIDNTVRALELVLARGRGGQAYYAFDDGTITIRDFLTAILDAHGLPPPTKGISKRAAWMAGAVSDACWPPCVVRASHLSRGSPSPSTAIRSLCRTPRYAGSWATSRSSRATTHLWLSAADARAGAGLAARQLCLGVCAGACSSAESNVQFSKESQASLHSPQGG